MNSYGLFSQVCQLRNYISKRASSWDKTGGNDDWVNIHKNGGKHILLDVKQPGCIKHFYWTFVHEDDGWNIKELHKRNNIFRGMVLRAYWDGSDKPSIEVPLGDFFGVSNGQFRSIKSLAFTANSGSKGQIDHATWGFNCYLPMPFYKGAHIEIENQGEYDGKIWYHVDYELYDDVSLIPQNSGLLHACWKRENPTQALMPKNGKNLTGDNNYIVLDIRGNGQFAGYFLTVVNNQPIWWGEGDDMIFIDGEKFPPSIHGTGSEEIFGGGACPDSEYTGPYTGFHCIQNKSGYRWWGTNGMYRFHLSDPIRFKKSIKLTIEHGHANNMSNEYSSVAFWYQDNANRDLERLPKIDKRLISQENL